MKNRTMRKKYVILGLVLLFIGLAAFGWGLYEQEKGKKLLQKQNKIFNYELAELTDLINNKDESYSFDTFEKERKKQLATYKTRGEIRELIFSVSIVSVVIGSTLLVYWPVLWIMRLGTKPLFRLPEFRTGFYVRLWKNRYKQQQEIDPDKAANNQQNFQVLRKSKDNNSDKNKSRLSANEKVSVLLCDKESLDYNTSSKVQGESQILNERPFEKLAQNIHETILSGYNEKNSKFEELLRVQAENMNQRATELKQATQTVKKASRENSEPINSALEELTQQISAIRDYASNQQDRMEKLQDGYDWNIIKSFCLRIIRCIDNVEKRIEFLKKDDVDTTNYEEIRDELIFALESNGLEQFIPEIKSDYRQQEKYIETVKGKEYTDSPELEGKIAQVLRRGYRCIIDEENIKVVRTARVKLFGCAGSLNEVKK